MKQSAPERTPVKLLMFTNTEWHLYNFRLPLARAARRAGYDVVLVCPPGKYADLMVEEGFRHVPVMVEQGGTNPVRDSALIATLVRLYRAEQPDIVHHFSIKPVLYGSIAARLAGNPAIINAVPGQGYVFTGSGVRRGAIRALASALYRVALSGRRTQVMFQNPEDRDAFVERGFVRPEQAVLIRGSGVDLQRFSPAPGSATPTVLFASRLLVDKGIRDFVEAARIIRSRNPSVRFQVAGGPRPGHPASISEDEIAQWRRDGHVEVLGHRDDITSLMSDSWMTVLPTTYGEGVPRVLLEAAAMGKPLVGTDVAGVREIVLDGETGLLVPPGDVGALVAALERLLADGALRARLGQRAREIAVTEFDETSIIGRTLALYPPLPAAAPARHATAAG